MSSEIENILIEMKETASVVFLHGWAEANAGNMSYRLSEEVSYNKNERFELSDRYENLIGKAIIITSSGSRMRHIASGNPEDYCSVIVIDESGTGYYRSEKYNKIPSSELLAHLMLHNEYEIKNKDMKAVLHCHPNEIISLLHLSVFKTKEAVNKMIFSIHNEALNIVPEGVGVIGVKIPGSYELASAIFSELKKREIALIEKHGCISIGKDFNEALDKIEFVNKAVRIYLDIRNLR